MRHVLLCLACLPLLLACPKEKDGSDETMQGSCDENACMQSCQAKGGTGTCSNGQCACQIPDAGPGPVDAGWVHQGYVPGGACSCDAECAGDSNNPGLCVDGVCMQKARGPCSSGGSTAECPEGSRCWTLTVSQLNVCWPDCESFECAGSCDESGSCIPGRGTSCDPACGSVCPETITGKVGSACGTDDDCTAGVCYPESLSNEPTGFVGGYCLIGGCTASSCPSGSACVSRTGGSSKVCMASCTTSADCRSGYQCRDEDSTCWPDCMDSTQCPMGYTCRDYACVRASLLCSPDNPHGLCAEDEWCNAGHCELFTCAPDSHEPNNERATAQLAASGTLTGLTICGGDNDYWKILVPAGHVTTVVLNHILKLGDLDLVSYDAAGNVMDSRLGNYPYLTRDYETDSEAVTFYNAAGADAEYVVRVTGSLSSTSSPYELKVFNTPFSDAATCTEAGYADCEGRGALGSGLINFPHPDPEEPYVGAGYMFDSVSNYRWLRRETIMLVRHALHMTFAQFPGTHPVGLIDMCQSNGVTPGYDINDPRHPASTHDQGGNVDIAYFQTGPDNHARVICGPNESNTDGYYCTDAATTQHVVDLRRQVYFMAQLFSHPRMRVIGADQVIAPLLQAEAEQMATEGLITTAQRDAFHTMMAYGDGWPFHHHHIHVSLEWW